MRVILSAAVLAAMLSSQALATFDLQITEIWSGQPGATITEDWFELTNYGDMAWESAVDGDLWYDDSSANPSASVLLTGISTILPGQSVIFLEDANTSIDELDPADDTDAIFASAWEPVKGSQIIGGFSGSGLSLSSGGDGVNVWLGDPRSGGTLLDSEAVPAQSIIFFPAASWDVVLGGWSTIGNASGAVATLVLGGDEGDTPAIGSPGMVVPEPSCIALLGLTLVGLVVRRPKS